MRHPFLFFVLLCALHASAQSDTSSWIRSFPITGYVVSLNDSTTVVQLKLPAVVTIPEKTPGLLRGIYRDNKPDTMLLGTGRCQLIKGEYYYFSIALRPGARKPLEGDLLFVPVPRKKIYAGRATELARQFVGLQNVHEERLFDRYLVFDEWTAGRESSLLDSIVSDIRFTGGYFRAENPSMNEKIGSGPYQGRGVLDAMIACERKDVQEFLDYMIARPRLYAGHQWKVSEIFATWLTAGAPRVLRR